MTTYMPCTSDFLYDPSSVTTCMPCSSDCLYIPSSMTTLLHTFQILPPPEAATAEIFLPLRFFDISWIHFIPVRYLIFYEFPCSKHYFIDTLIPNLKHSLSLTLKHYIPLAGNLLYPLNTDNKPIIRFTPGDSVSLTVAESANDFDNLVGYHARDADQFYDFVPHLPLKEGPEYKSVPVVAVKVTLFPGRGICVGFANLHCLGDASSIVGFINSWALISKFGGDEEYLSKHADLLPLFDKSLVKDPKGIDDIFWSRKKNIPFKETTFPLPTGRDRATFIFKQTDINNLKDFVLSKYPNLVSVSSFVVTTAYIWACLTKSSEEIVNDQFFIFAVDCRSRISPPLPSNYFGNCLGYGLGKIENRELVKKDGFVFAAKSIADEITNRINNKEEVLKDVENWSSKLRILSGGRVTAISGSPKFDLYSADFGWGKVRKVETVTIDGEKSSFSLCKSREFEGGLEVGLSLPKKRLQTFADIFEDGLKFE